MATTPVERICISCILKVPRSFGNSNTEVIILWGIKMTPENGLEGPLWRVANEYHLVHTLSHSGQALLIDPSIFSPSNLAPKTISKQTLRQTATTNRSEFPCELKLTPD